MASLELLYTGTVDSEGNLSIQNRKGFIQDLKLFAGQKVKLSVKKYRKSRSLKQNALFHAYIHEIADQTSMPADTVKSAMKAQFLTVDVKDEDGNVICNPITGETLKEVRDTSDLDTLEMFELCENIRIFMMDFGVYLKAPNEQEELKFKDL